MRAPFHRWLGGMLLGILLAACTAQPADAGRTFGFGFRHKTQTIVPQPAPPVVTSGITYDTAMGTAVDANGFASLPLRAGAHAFYVKSTGSDANSCATAESAATPKATPGNAETCILDGRGDHVLLAQDDTFAGALISMENRSGFSPAYPTTIESFDPADPTNQAKWGRATGTHRPVLTATTHNVLFGTNAPHYLAWRGLDFNPGDVPDAAVGMTATASGTLSYVLWENNIFRHTAPGINNSTTLNAPNGYKWIERNNAIYGDWSTSVPGSMGLFLSHFDGAVLEDNVFWHTGWRIGQPDNATYDIGGKNNRNHAIYAYDDNTTMVVRRNAFIDNSGDGGNLKGGGLYTFNLGLRNPEVSANGMGNSNPINAPFGTDIDVSFNATAGGNVTSGLSTGVYLGATDGGIFAGYSRPGSAIHHNVMAYSSVKGGFAYVLQDPPDVDTGFTGTLTTIDVHHNVSWQWTTSGNTSQIGFGGGTVNATFNNNKWDDPASGTNVAASGVTFPTAYTESTLLTALGYASETAAATAWVNNPELHGWRTGVSLMQTGYGITKAQADLTTNMKIQAGQTRSALFFNTLDGGVLSAVSGFPACVTINATSASWNASTACTASSGTGIVRETIGGNTHDSNIAWVIGNAPTLSSLSVTPGTTSATLNSSTNVGSGLLYALADADTSATDWRYVRVGYAGSSPHAATAYSTQAVSGTGAQSGIVLSGLTASTGYRAQVVQVDANWNVSAVSTLDFTTNAVVSWTPASLGSSLNAWYEVADASTLYQDTGCSTAVTADLQTAKCITDKSGNGRNATSLVGWVYHAGAKPYLQMDGSNTFITSNFAFADGSGQHFVAITASVTDVTSDQILVAIPSTSWIDNQSSSNIRALAFDTLGNAQEDHAAALTSGTPVVLMHNVTTSTIEVFKDNVSDGSSALTGTRPTTAQRLEFGGSQAYGLPTAGKFYGLVEGSGAISSTNRGNLQTYEAALH